jgi:hypothetical protein
VVVVFGVVGHESCGLGELSGQSGEPLAGDAVIRSRLCDLPAQHRQLMPQHQDLHVLGGVRPRQQGKPAE